MLDYIYLFLLFQISDLRYAFSGNLTLHLNIPEAHWESLSDRNDMEKQKEDLDRDRNRDAVELGK